MPLKSSPLITFVALMRAISGLAFALLALRVLGASSYGYFSVIWSLMSAMLIFFGGINTALVARIVAMRDRDDDTALELCGAVGFLALGLALTLILVGIVITAWAPAVALPSELFVGGAFLLSLQLITVWCCATLEGHGYLRPAILLPLLGVSTNSVLLAITWINGWQLHLPSFIILCGVGYILETGLALFATRLYGVLSLKVRSAWLQLRGLFISGAALQVSSLASFFLDPFNKTVLLAWQGPAAVALFDLAMKMAWGLQSAFTAYARLFLQIAPSEHSARVKSFYMAADYVWTPALLAAALVVLWATPLLASMIANTQPAVAATVLLLALGAILTMILAAPAYVSLIGLGEHGFILRNQLILAGGSSIGALVLVPQLGITGVIWGLFVASAFNAFFTWRRVRRCVTGFAGLHVLFRGRIRRIILAFGSIIAAWVLQQMDLSANWGWSSILTLLVFLQLVREPSINYMLQRLLRNI